MSRASNPALLGATLAFHHVSVRYAGRPQRALDQVSVEAAPGQITAVVGPNGSGKSTLVRTLLRRVPLESGHVTVGNAQAGHIPVTTLHARDLAQRVAIVPQREEPVQQAVHRAGIADALGRRTDTLSGGEWQRVRIARALAQAAPVLVLDEPTTFLDIAHEMAVFELLDELAKQGQTVLLVSHQLNLVARFASHIVLLHRGAVAAAGDATAVMRGEILERVYEWPLVVTRDPAVGAPALLPLRGSGRHRDQ